MKTIIACLFTLAFIFPQALAQPYYFFHQRNGAIHQIDLSNNVTGVFLYGFSGIRNLSWDPDQRFLFVDSEGGMEIVEIRNLSNRHMLIPNLGEYGGTEGALIAGNRLYVTWLNEQNNQTLQGQISSVSMTFRTLEQSLLGLHTMP